MIRDWEIIREILLRLEGSSTANSFVDANSFSTLDAQEVAYNMRLLSDAGYIEARILNSSEGDNRIAAAVALRLTNRGHDLLDTIKNQSVWTKVKDKFSKNGLDMTFDLVLTVGKKIIEAML